MTEIALFSRAALAGYDPQLLHNAKVLVVGLGALGQNAVQGLVLSGVGRLLLVDFDDFEGHNATRSPFFPSDRERDELGLRKARVVAARAARCATAPQAQVRFADDLVQVLGDGPIRWADVVVSAVDSVSARAWLAERCRIHGRPMVEAGFAGPSFNLSAFAPDDDTTCYRCFHGSRESAASCTRYALAAEAASIVPAIQATAAVLGGLVTEQTIQILQGGYPHYGTRLYGDVRRLTTNLVRLPVNPTCPGQHQVLPVLAELDRTPADLDELRHLVDKALGPAWLILAEPAILSQACTHCDRMCRVVATEAAWLRAPRCDECDGPWPRTPEQSPEAVRMVHTVGDLSILAQNLGLAGLGLGPAGAITVHSEDSRSGVVIVPGPAGEFGLPAPPCQGAEFAGAREAGR